MCGKVRRRIISESAKFSLFLARGNRFGLSYKVRIFTVLYFDDLQVTEVLTQFWRYFQLFQRASEKSITMTMLATQNQRTYQGDYGDFAE